MMEASKTDAEGAYFFQVPTGRTYMVQFDINASEFGYLSVMDIDTHMLGWTSYESLINDRPIQ